jgi:hypothetical protein
MGIPLLHSGQALRLSEPRGFFPRRKFQKSFSFLREKQNRQAATPRRTDRGAVEEPQSLPLHCVQGKL